MKIKFLLANLFSILIFFSQTSAQSIDPIIEDELIMSLKKAYIICAYKCDEVKESCNKEKAILKKQGYHVEIIEVDGDTSIQDIIDQLEDNSLIIIDGHGQSDGDDKCENDFEFVDSESVCLTEEEINQIIPNNCDVIVNTCYAGELDIAQCDLLIQICGNRTITFPVSQEIMENLLICYNENENLEQIKNTMCETFELKNSEQERENFKQECKKNKGRVSDAMPIDAYYELHCKVSYKCSPDQKSTYTDTVVLDVPDNSAEYINSCDDQIDFITRGCSIINRENTFVEVPAKEQLCCIDQLATVVEIVPGTQTTITR